jgi:DNA-binding MarR family transcriptional regulator
MTGWELIGRLWRFQHAAFELAGDELAAVGLHPKALVVLVMLRHFRHPADVARALSIPAPTLSNILRELESRGYVRRDSDREDRRRFIVTLTAEGEAALAAGEAAVESSLGPRLAALNPERRSEIERAVETLEGLLPNPFLGSLLERPAAEG